DCDGGRGCEGRTTPSRSFWRVCASPVRTRQQGGRDSDGKTGQPARQDVRYGNSVRILSEQLAWWDGWPYLPANLCRAFSGLFPVRLSFWSFVRTNLPAPGNLQSTHNE